VKKVKGWASPKNRGYAHPIRNKSVCRACAGAGWTGGTESGVDSDGFPVILETRRPCLECKKTGFVPKEKAPKGRRPKCPTT